MQRKVKGWLWLADYSYISVGFVFFGPPIVLFFIAFDYIIIREETKRISANTNNLILKKAQSNAKN